MTVPILPTISTTFIVLSAIYVAVGWMKIKNVISKVIKNDDSRRNICVNLFILYASRTIFVGNTSFGGPEEYKIFYTVFLIFHITLATTGGVLGFISLWTGYKNKLDRHRKLGPITSVVWFFTAITGVLVYLLLYVIYRGGETTSLIKAILGF
ncbi:DUF420 domain-containing protein [Bacillus sp. N9]